MPIHIDCVAANTGRSCVFVVKTSQQLQHDELQGVIRTPNCQLKQYDCAACRAAAATAESAVRRLCATAADSASNQISRREFEYAAAALSLSQLSTNSPAFAEGSGGDQQAYIDPDDGIAQTALLFFSLASKPIPLTDSLGVNSDHVQRFSSDWRVHMVGTAHQKSTHSGARV